MALKTRRVEALMHKSTEAESPHVNVVQKEDRCLGVAPINYMMDRISNCEALAKRNEIVPFLKRMVTADEKWVTYDNIV
ncbi:hypothetical protein TNCV_4245981 [Trichonephila clavipes]|nr:hypothetical protein TNCV_4245981 [Trichonephila clavipes]